MNISKIKQLLTSNEVSLHPGLSDETIHTIETFYQFRFPPDLRQLLSQVQPTGRGFPIWGDFSKRGIALMQQYLNAPLEGILFDIQYNSFWYPAWGERPANHQAAQEIARQQYSQLPKLIPIYGHRYMPTEPHEVGNPVLSVHQTDVIPYGVDLEDYVQIEFGDKLYTDMQFEKIKHIRFWLELDS
ncbi:SMI1/KNR4 family protein [Paenibacillus kandeliae]|uniref:SMI1/KNR4 family protein n=1 Tax=Paenibacillus kandeliae TaxID=3231269 RepID=UPI003458082B